MQSIPHQPSKEEEESSPPSYLFKFIKFLAYYQNMLLRRLPNFITDSFPPQLMGKAYIRRAKANTANIPVTMTSQAICARHCGNCPSNPFTQGGLYCISGKSKKPVREVGCNCFDCELFDKCGGVGYFCKFGSADEMHKNPSLFNKLLSSKEFVPPGERQPSAEEIKQKSAMLSEAQHAVNITPQNAYHQRFIQALITKKEREFSSMLAKLDGKSKVKQKKELSIQYDNIKDKVVSPQGKTILEISLANDIPHTHVCGGRAKCSTCKVLIISGNANLPPRNNNERLIAIRKQFPPQVRLACQTIPQGDITLRRIVRNEGDTKLAIADTAHTANFFCIDSHVAVLFADIRAFTTFSETNLAYDVVQILNEYFTTISSSIDKYKGYIDKYMGDGIMAIFGIEQSSHKPEYAALKAALDMMVGLREFNNNLKEHYQHEFKIGIGIDAGEVVMAKLGSQLKSQFTAIGDIVNTSSRIESVTKEHQANILVSHNVYSAVKERFIWGRKISSQLKGKLSITTFYEALEEKADKKVAARK